LIRSFKIWQNHGLQCHPQRRWLQKLREVCQTAGLPAYCWTPQHMRGDPPYDLLPDRYWLRVPEGANLGRAGLNAPSPR
jgi:hypothetical protein